ncbi:MAG: FAD-dependent monooxygenase [Taibaiella sp.]|nr:FAD-dependent monooxygenase [Taibaiella sp.]
MTDSRPMNVLVVGGGIAGIVLAILLERDGHRVTIVERAPEIMPVGGGITLTMNGIGMLRRLGLMDDLEPYLHKIKRINIDAIRLGTLSSFMLDDEKSSREVYSVLRSDLHSRLLAHLRMTRMVKGTSVHLYSQSPEGVSVTFSDGRNEWFDIVAGCDGINSATRASMFGEAGRSFAGYASWRFLAKSDGVYDPSLITEVWGIGKRFGIVPLPGGLVHCFAATNCRDSCGENENMDVTAFKAMFRGFGSASDYFVEQVSHSSQLMYNGLEDIRLPAWYSGRIVLVGDAAHGMTPNLTQGASMALEDAYVLAMALRNGSSVEAAFSWYFQCRRRRVLAIQKKSWWLGKVAQIASPWLCRLRDRCWKRIPDRWLQGDLEKLLVETTDAFYSPAKA